MKLDLEWVRQFPTTQGTSIVAMGLIVIMSLVAIVKWDSPPEGLMYFLGGLATLGTIQFGVKRVTDHEYVKQKGAQQVAVETARASAPAPVPPMVVRTTQESGVIVTEVVAGVPVEPLPKPPAPVPSTEPDAKVDDERGDYPDREST